MEIEITPEGVEIWHRTPEEWDAYADEETRRVTRYQTAKEFKAAYLRGEIRDEDDYDGEIFSLRMTLWAAGVWDDEDDVDRE